MGELTRKQAKLLKRQISKLYNRDYIPLRTSDSTIEVGDVLKNRFDVIPEVDGSVLNVGADDYEDGTKYNNNITSNSDVKVQVKLAGDAHLTELFDIDEAGVKVDFSGKNEMLLKVKGLRQRSLKNVPEVKRRIMERFVKGEISSKVFVVVGVVLADKYYLQYSGKRGGSVAFTIEGDVTGVDVEVDADFKYKMEKDVSYSVDGKNGGVLAYAVSSLRLNKYLLSPDINRRLLDGESEAEIMEAMSEDERKALIDSDAIELSDLSAQFFLNQLEEEGDDA